MRAQYMQGAHMLTTDADMPAQSSLQALLVEPQTWLLLALADLSEQQRPAPQYASQSLHEKGQSAATYTLTLSRSRF